MIFWRRPSGRARSWCFRDGAFGGLLQPVVHRENGCDRYYKYNKGLLFNERQQEISGRIEEARDMMTGADRT